MRAGFVLACALLLLSWPFAVRGEAVRTAMPSDTAFRELAVTLAQKVPLFRKAWSDDPDAAFFGGTVRDYLLWLAGKLDDGVQRGAVETVIADLLARPLVDHREFVAADSDIDVFSSRGVPSLDAAHLGVKRVDVRSPQALDPTSSEAQTHRDQGFLPAEKLVLTRDKLQPLLPDLGDGVEEIRTGRYTVTFADDATFWRSHFAAKGWNHPVFLALRYVRLLAADAYHRRKPNAVGLDAIRDRLDAKSMDAVAKVFAASGGDKKLFEISREELFHAKLDATIQRAFSGYCDATVASQLHQHFKTTPLFRWVGKLKPIHQHLFAKRRDPSVLLANWQKYGVNRTQFFAPHEKYFPDGLLYHGTRTDEGLRDIAVRGVLPSGTGSAGDGLYGTSRDNVKKILPSYAGNDMDRVVRFEITPSATVVDITTGHGADVYRRWNADNGGRGETAFCEAFGIDILRYDYDFPAFVVKNAQALGTARTAVARRTLSDLLEEAATVRGVAELEELVRAARANRLDVWEEREVLMRTPYVKALPSAHDHRLFVRTLAGERLSRDTAMILARHLPGSHVASVVAAIADKHAVFKTVHEPLEHLAVALSLWGETKDDAAVAAAMLRLATVLQHTYVPASHLPELLAPLTTLLTSPADAPALAQALGIQGTRIERDARKALRKERRQIFGGYGATMGLGLGVIAGVAGALFGWDWLLAHQLGIEAWHVGVTTTAAAGAMLFLHDRMNGAEFEDFFVAAVIAGAGFVVDLPFSWMGVPEYAAGLSASILGIGGALLVGHEAWTDTRHELRRATEHAEAARANREQHLKAVLDAVVKDCATELAEAS